MFRTILRKPRRLTRYLFHLRDEGTETFDAATRAHPVLNGFALRAYAGVIGLKIKAPVEIQRRAFVIHHRANARSVPHNEVDRRRPGQHSARNPIGAHAFWALLLFPLKSLGKLGPGPNRDADDDLVLDDHSSNDLGLRRILSRHSEQGRNQSKKGKQRHRGKTIATSGSTRKL